MRQAPSHFSTRRLAAVSDIMPYSTTGTVRQVQWHLSTPHRHTEEIQVQCHSVLTPALDVSEWPASLHGRFIPTDQEGGRVAYLL